MFRRKKLEEYRERKVKEKWGEKKDFVKLFKASTGLKC